MEDFLPKDKDCDPIPMPAGPVSLSSSARTSLRWARDILRDHPAFMAQERSYSVLVEFLVEYWLSSGKLEFHEFVPKTRPRGRPPREVGLNTPLDQARPITVRKVSGLKKASPGLPSEPDQG